jgi:ABC-type sugar transport system substrate-binding protein
MFRADPQIGVVWCASDAMALGALSAALEAGRRPGKDVLIGGVDLIDRALEEVAAGRLEVSVGGHVVDGAYALVLLHDQHRTCDDTPQERTSRLVAVRAAEAHRYQRYIHERAWHVGDFTRFSRVRNPAATDTELSLQKLIEV